MKRFDLIVFDWDGTLMDSTGVITDSIQCACRELGTQVPDVNVARYVIGLGLHEAMRHVAPDFPQHRFAELVDCYRKYYVQRAEDLYLFEGVLPMLTELKHSQYFLAVATGKSRRGLQHALSLGGLHDYFHATRCADESQSKPHPAMLLELCDELNISRERTLMIGDTTHDLQMAVNAGVAALAVSYGAHSEKELQALKPLAIVDSAHALHQWLLKHA